MLKLFSNQGFLTIYSGVLTAVFAATIFGGIASPDKKETVEELNVQRINILEPDGTLRMVVSNKTRAPGLIIRGKEYPHNNRKTAGILFFNDEGTENGGLIFGGMKGKDGKVQNWGHLSFDQYEQDQVFTIDAGEEAGRRKSGIAIWDRGDYSILDAIHEAGRIEKLPSAQQRAEWKKFATTHPGDTQRAYLGRVGDRTVGLRLMDEKGHDRFNLRVDSSGSAIMQFLDENGKVISQFPPTTDHH